ncbi:MAG TPA: hypothetical protein VD837_20045 [Terriglobales bacterium]|nr:hypothetical protein [Terriglobales bacterium]
MPFKTCTHVKADGLRCGSPALRGQSFCYFHHHSPDHRPRTQHRMVNIPFPENAAAIQVGLHNVMLAIIDRRIDDRRASQLLWALQIAASQGRQLPFDNNLHMSRTVTELPEYELEAEREKEEERRTLEELRAPRSAPAHSSSDQKTSVIPSAAAPQKSSVIPSAAAPQKEPVIPSAAAPRGEVEGPAFPARQQPPARKPTRSKGERKFDFEKETRKALAGDWRATDRLFRAAGLIAPKAAT